MMFQRYIGINYSGAQTPESRLKALQVYVVACDGEPVKVRLPKARRTGRGSRLHNTVLRRLNPTSL